MARRRLGYAAALGEAWFEKPALLYWMTGAGFRLGLGDELAPRLQWRC